VGAHNEGMDEFNKLQRRLEALEKKVRTAEARAAAIQRATTADLVRINNACARLGCCRTKLYRLRDLGVVTFVYPFGPRSPRIRRADLDRLTGTTR